MSIQLVSTGIKEKSTDIKRRLAPFLYGADMDTKKNMWQVFVQPLCEFILPLYSWEEAEGLMRKAETVIRGSFKIFTGLSRGTENRIVDMLSGYDFKRRARMIRWLSMEKWEARKVRRSVDLDQMPEEIRPLETRNLCKRMPLEFVHYINIGKSRCKQCQVGNTSSSI